MLDICFKMFILIPEGKLSDYDHLKHVSTNLVIVVQTSLAVWFKHLFSDSG